MDEHLLDASGRPTEGAAQSPAHLTKDYKGIGFWGTDNDMKGTM